MRRRLIAGVAAVLMLVGCSGARSGKIDEAPPKNVDGGPPYIFVGRHGGPPKLIDPGGFGSGEVIVLTPEGEIVGRIATDGRVSQMARHGPILYIADGQTLQVWNLAEWNHVWARPRLSLGPIALTPDGSRLWLGVRLPPGPGNAGRLGVQEYDPKRGEAIGDPVETYPCFVLSVFLGPGAQVAQLCAAGPVAVVQNGKLSDSISAGPVSYSRSGDIYVGYGSGDPYGGHAGAFRLASDANKVLVVGARGALITVNLAKRTAEATGTLPFGGRVIPWRQAALSPDGARLYVGLGPDRGGTVQDPVAYFSTDSIHRFNLKSGAEEAEWKLTKPITSLAITPDGKYLVGLASRDNALLILNAETGDLVREVSDLGADLWTLAIFQ